MAGTRKLRKVWVKFYRSNKRGSDKELKAYRNYVMSSMGVKVR